MDADGIGIHFGKANPASLLAQRLRCHPATSGLCNLNTWPTEAMHAKKGQASCSWRLLPAHPRGIGTSLR